jgi:hypothetical protein
LQLDNRSKTLVIPTFTKNKELEDSAFKCAVSHKEQVDQIIISEDGGQFSEKLMSIADVYIYNRWNMGFTRNVNRAWQMSDTDFTIIANSDTYLLSGNLIDICRNNPDQVCCPVIKDKESPLDGFTGSYFVVPKLIKDQYGMLDERLKMFMSDVDYYHRIKDIFQVEGRVVIKHQKAASLKVSGKNIETLQRMDAEKYDEILNEHSEMTIRK